jgi:spermidine synthase
MHVFLLASFFCCASTPEAAGSSPASKMGTIQAEALPSGGLELRSDYSHILVKDKGSVRSLYFVRDSGEKVLETSVDLARPRDLALPYTQAMMAGNILRPDAEKALIVGLGGGAMVHFLAGAFPDMAIDAVEIDPVIVGLAQSHFGLRPSDTIQLHAADGFAWIAKGVPEYDIVYMDAFLKPSEDTDSTGVPLRLKTLEFYAQIRGRLRPGGVVVFNINHHAGLGEDIGTIDEAFGRIWSIQVPNRGNVVVVASTGEPLSAVALLGAAQSLDGRGVAAFSFVEWAGLMR